MFPVSAKLLQSNFSFWADFWIQYNLLQIIFSDYLNSGLLTKIDYRQKTEVRESILMVLDQTINI